MAEKTAIRQFGNSKIKSGNSRKKWKKSLKINQNIFVKSAAVGKSLKIFIWKRIVVKIVKKLVQIENRL